MRRKPKKEEVWTDSVEPVADSTVQFTDDEWHQPGSDNKGHSAKLSCRVPPPVHRLIESLIASQRFPYQTADDLVRHAVVRHLHALLSYDQTIPRTLYTTASAIIRLVQDHEAMLTMRESVIRAAGMLGELVEEKDYAEIARVIAFIDAALAQMPDTSPWKRRFLSHWREKSERYRKLCVETSATPGICPSNLPNHIDI